MSSAPPPGTADPGEGVVPNPARLWTPDEANQRLVDLRDRLSELRGWVGRLRQIQEEIGRLGAFWGKELAASDHPDRALVDRLKSEWSQLSDRVDHQLLRLRAEGIEVKDLETGLIDFYGVVHQEVVFLCWRSDEEEVAHFHSIQGGFRGRRPLPQRAHRARVRG